VERGIANGQLRTHAGDRGAALFTIVSAYGFSGGGRPGRIAAQIVTGIGFIGAGAILHYRGNVKGLTTAASLGQLRSGWRPAPNTSSWPQPAWCWPRYWILDRWTWP
jgi:hypothetical protein